MSTASLRLDAQRRPDCSATVQEYASQLAPLTVREAMKVIDRRTRSKTHG
jgi:hypothetical protein